MGGHAVDSCDLHKEVYHDVGDHHALHRAYPHPAAPKVLDGGARGRGKKAGMDVLGGLDLSERVVCYRLQRVRTSLVRSPRMGLRYRRWSPEQLDGPTRSNA